MAIVVGIEVSEFIDLAGLRLVSVTDDDILVTSESVDELKVVLSWCVLLNGVYVLVNTHWRFR